MKNKKHNNEGFRIITKNRKTNKSTFYNLVDLNILENSFAEKISNSAKIRNQIVHEYEKLSKEDVILNIKKYYELYREYLKILIEKFNFTDEKEQ